MSTERFRLVLVSAGTSDPSSTRLLADRTADRVKALAARRGHEVTVGVIELREISADISTALVSQLITPKLQQAITALAEAGRHRRRRAGLQGQPERPVQLVLSRPGQRPADRQAGGAGRDGRHRPARPGRGRPDAPDVRLPAHDDGADLAVRRAGGLERPGPEHPDRPGRGRAGAADGERLRRQIKDESWQSYQHEFGSAGGTETAIDLDSDMMRLATGGSAS
jgi:hypothetical protein